MTNQFSRDLTLEAHDLDDQQLEAVAGGIIKYHVPTREEWEELKRRQERNPNGH